MLHDNTHSVKAPRTKTPPDVYIYTLFLLLGGGFLFWKIFFGPPGLIIFLVVMGLANKIFAQEVPQFHAIIVNDINGKMRVMFSGLNLKKLWEKKQKKDDGETSKYIDLRAELTEVGAEPETYTSSEGTLMKSKFNIKIEIDCKGENASENVLKYAGVEDHVILHDGKGRVSKLLSDYFATKPENDLMKKAAVEKGALNPDGSLVAELADFENKYGVTIHVTLTDVDRHPDTQKFKNLISEATSTGQAIEKLVAAGLSPEVAATWVKLNSFPNFSEHKYDVSLDTAGLENLQNFHIGTAGLFGGTPKNKGGNK